jgi:hypothetical protein
MKIIISHGNCNVWRSLLLLSVSKPLSTLGGSFLRTRYFLRVKDIFCFYGTGYNVIVLIIARQLSQPMPSLPFSLLLKVIYNSLKELQGIFDLASIEILSPLCWVKGKGVPNRPGVAQRVPGGLGSQIPWYSAHEGDEAVSLTHRPPLAPGNVPGTHFQ